MSEDDTNQTKLNDFFNVVEEQMSEHRESFGAGEITDRETLRTERDVLYQGYILEGYTSDVQGKFGTNTAIRVTSSDGEKLTLWVNNYEEEHFLQFMNGRINQAGHELPVKISFVRTQRTAEKTGKSYNKIVFRLDAAGEEVQFELDSL